VGGCNIISDSKESSHGCNKWPKGISKLLWPAGNTESQGQLLLHHVYDVPVPVHYDVLVLVPRRPTSEDFSRCRGGQPARTFLDVTCTFTLNHD
jgi:hypothetical protein